MCSNCAGDYENPDATVAVVVCANCGHSKDDHWDRYGCQVDGGDVWVEGNNCGGLVAAGPCGCMEWEPEVDDAD